MEEGAGVLGSANCGRVRRGRMVQGLYYQLLDQYEGGGGLRTMKTATLFIDVAPKWESNIGESLRADVSRRTSIARLP